MTCPGCGQRNPPTAQFCTICGRTLSGVARAGPEPALHYAGFGSRCGAFLLDLVLVYGVTFVAGAVWITQKAKGPDRDTLQLLLYPAIYGIGWLYWAGLEASPLQGTLGKRAFGLMVTDLAGGRISFGRASGRYFGKIFSVMLFYIGFFMAAFTAKKQALHDLMAGTLVVVGSTRPTPVSTAPLPVQQHDMNKPFYP